MQFFSGGLGAAGGMTALKESLRTTSGSGAGTVGSGAGAGAGSGTAGAGAGAGAEARVGTAERNGEAVPCAEGVRTMRESEARREFEAAIESQEQQGGEGSAS